MLSHHMPFGPYEKILTTEELATHLRVSTDTIQRMEMDGKLPPPIRSAPLGKGRGRCVVRWDLWTVCRHLDGSSRNRSDRDRPDRGGLNRS